MTKMKLIGVSMVVALCAISGCKKKKPETTTSAGTGSAIVTTGSDAVGSGAGSGSAMAGSGAAMTGSGSADATGSGSAGAAAAPPAPTAAIKFDKLPDSWERMDEADGGTLETVEAVNDSKFPVDNAQFRFGFNKAAAGAPTDPAKYGEWFALEMKTKAEKTEQLGDATYFVFAGPKDGDGDKTWHVVKKLGDQLYWCGGDTYQAGDYKKIAKVSAAVVATAKKLCASMTL